MPAAVLVVCLIVLGPHVCLFCLPIPIPSLQRSTKIEVRYQDLQGQQQEMQLSDFVARIFQHEYDHLQVRAVRGGSLIRGWGGDTP